MSHIAFYTSEALGYQNISSVKKEKVFFLYALAVDINVNIIYNIIR